MQAIKEEQVKYWMIPQLHNLELLHATYVNHSFRKHMHEGYAIGVIEQGALAFHYRGGKVVAPAGDINLVIPGEAHDGAAASGVGWTYRMFYLESNLMGQAAYEVTGKMERLPFFRAGTIRDNHLASFIKEFHQMLEEPNIPLLEQQSLLLLLLTEFIKRHADDYNQLMPIGSEHAAVAQARRYIEDRYTCNICLQDLAKHCYLSPYHLVRVFKHAIGVPPHVYLKQIRVKRAKELLGKGVPLAIAGQMVGFADQSHFSKQFKQITGISPRKYSNIVQEIYPPKGKI